MRLARVSERAERRMRLSHLLDALFVHLRLGLLVAVATLLALRFTAWIPPWLARDLLLGAALQLVLGLAWALRFRPPELSGALALDAHHRLDGRISNALAFAKLPPTERTPFMEAAIRDACERAVVLLPKSAVPLERPRHLLATAGLGISVLAIAALPTKAEPLRPSDPPRAAILQPIRLADDDLALYREIARELSREGHDESVREAASSLDRLIEEMAEGGLDRVDAFRRLRDIEESLVKARGLDPEALDDQLRQRARALAGSELLVPLRKALDEKSLSDAERALRELAERMREQPSSFREEELARLRAAMKKAASSQRERLEALEKHRRELAEQLLLRRERAGTGEQEDRLLARDERRLERLEREKDELSEAGRKLERLDRELEQAAEDILRELGMSADSLERGAEDINRLAREQMSEASREELRQRLEDLREQLRQAGQGAEGEEQRARLNRFVRLAKGQGSGGEPGDRKGEGQGRGDGEAPADVKAVGEGGEKALIVQRGSSTSPTRGGEAGQGAGEGHEGRLLGKGKNAEMETMDVQAVGLDTGEGASRSAVIQGASGRGFRGGGYRRVYTEYRTVAEERLRADEIPSGAKTHIRRYFDLIRPRD